MGEEAVCVQALADERVENNEEPKTELKRDYDQCVADTEPLLSPNKKQAKEVSNDEVRSEVSNPNTTEHTLTFQDISSQPSESGNANHTECGELTSTCLENSSSGETLSDETGDHNNDNDDNNNNTSQNDKDMSSAADTSRVVVEIPKHASSSGIRKITFKFSKKKEDYGYQPTTPMHRPDLLTDGNRYAFHGDDEGYLAKEEFNNGYLDSSCGMEYVRDGELDLYSRNMELKMSKKVVPNCYPTNVKKLLSTGILDGANVKYVYNPGKVKQTFS